MKQTFIFLGLAIGVLSCQSEDSIEENENRDDSYAKITVAGAEQRIFEHYVTVQGAIEAEKMVMVIPEMGGLIRSLPVKAKEGQMVNQGEVLATFDSEVIASNIKELDEQIELAQYMYEKQKSLYDQGVGTELQMKQAEGQLNTLLQTKKSLMTQAGKFKLTAPFTGIVEEVYVVEGQMAGPSTPIIMLVGQGERKVVADVSEAYLATLNEGAKVNCDFPMLKETITGLTVTRIGGFVDPVNRTIQVEVDLPKPSNKMVPNLMANLNIRDMVDSSAIVIPSKVVMKGANKNLYVYTLEMNEELSTDSIARYSVVKRDIKTGSSYDGMITVVEGLSAGERVIDRGRADVYEKSIVEIVAE